MTEKIHRIFRKLEVKYAIHPSDRAWTVFSIFLFPSNIQEIISILKTGAVLIADRVAELVGEKVAFSSPVVETADVNEGDPIFLIVPHSEQTGIFKHFREPPP